MTDLYDRVYIEESWKDLPSGDIKHSILFEENCECMIDQGPEGPEGGWFTSPDLKEPDPHCHECGGYGRVIRIKEKIHRLTDYRSEIPF